MSTLALGGNFPNVELAFPSSFLKNITALNLNANHYFSSKLNETDCFLKVKKLDQQPVDDDPFIFLFFSFPPKEISRRLHKNKCAPIKWHFSNLSETSAEEIDKLCKNKTEPSECQIPPPRKRGRPKNSTKPKLPMAMPVPEETENNAKSGRYSLRGVKLSSKIMKLEMEEADDNFESDSDNDTKPVTKEVVVNDFQKEFLKFDGSKEETNQQDENFREENQKMKSIKSEMDEGDVHPNDDEIELDKSQANLERSHSELNTLCEVAAMERAVSVENVSNMTVHIDPAENITEDRREIICNLCPNSEIFSRKKDLRAHEIEKHSDLTCLFCDTPDKKYKHIYSLRGHVLTMHGENAGAQNNLCHLCSASYKFASTLKQHIEEIHEGIYKFECDICHKKFYRNSQLNRHKKIHMDSEMKMKCNVCGKGFWHEFNLQRHVRLLHNTQSEQFHCSYCGRPFSQKSSMIAHIQRLHFKLFKFKCDLCDSSFEQSKELVNHMSHIHEKKDFKLPQQKPAHNKYLKTPDEMFCCPSCTKRFCYKAELIVHIYSFHADTFPFHCRYCPQGFFRRPYLSRHRHVIHKEELSVEEEEELTLEMSSENLATEVTGNGEPISQGVEYLEEIDMNLDNADQQYVLVQAAEGQESEDSSFVENSENVTYVYDFDKSNEVPISVDSSNEIVTSGRETMMIDVEDEGQTIRYLIQPSKDGKTQTFKAEEFAKFIVAANNNDLEILNESEVKVTGSIEEVETLQL